MPMRRAAWEHELIIDEALGKGFQSGLDAGLLWIKDGNERKE